MRILLIVFLSFFAFSDDHDEMYQPGWAEYVYCNVKEGLFNYADKNDDGKLSKKELRKATNYMVRNRCPRD